MVVVLLLCLLFLPSIYLLGLLGTFQSSFEICDIPVWVTKERPGCATLGTMEDTKYTIMEKHVHGTDKWCTTWSE